MTEDDGYGLDAEARALARRREAASSRETEPLQPPFPYDFRAFDPDFFGLPGKPPEEGGDR